MAEPVRFNALQQRIHRRLGLLGGGPADFFADAVRIITSPERLATTTHLVGHLLREIESGLRDVLGIIVEPSPGKTKGEKHVREVQAILGALGFAEDDEVGERWLFIAGRDAPGGLHRHAHRDALNAPRRVDPDIVSQWEEIQLLLDAVLDRFEARYTEVFARLDELLTHEVPTPADLTVLKQVVPNTPATRRYFFERLTSTDWLTPLREEGFFDSPPAPEEQADETVSFPNWPEAEYLARVAAERPEDVAAIVSEVETDNVRVQARLTEVLMSLPPLRAAQLAPRVAEWLPQLTRYHHGQYPLRFAAYLGTNGHAGEALGLAAAIFGLPDRDEHGALPTKAAAPHRQRDLEWHLSEAPELLAPLIKAAPLEYVTLLADALDYHVGRRTDLGEETAARDTAALGVRDWSTTWLPDLTDTSRRRERDLRVLLAAALRDALNTLVEDGVAVADLVTLLRKHEPLVFRRLELDFLARHGDAEPQLSAERLAVREYLESSEFRNEFPSLLRAGYPLLSADDQQQVLEWIAAVPDFTWLRPEDRLEAGKRWQRNWLAVIAAHLPALWRERFDTLVAELGPPEPIERSVPESAVWTGPTSPKTEDELRAMSAPEVVAFLEQWEPSAERRSPSLDGLARTLAKVVAANASGYANEAHRFIGLAPIYVNALLEGLRIARQEGREFPWESVLALGAWVVEQPVSPSDLSESSDDEAEWLWVRRSVADLVAQGLGSAGLIALSERERVWRIISVLAEDVNPSPAFEERSGTTDPSTLAINTVRSEAMDAALRYAFWVAAGQREEGGPQPGFDVVPEVAQLLERHLNPGIDSSIAVRAAIGKRLGGLTIFDPPWVTEHFGLLLPPAPELAPLRDALWDAYLEWGIPSPPVLPVLEPAYRDAIVRARPREATPPTRGDSEQKLAEHLMQLYWGGAIPLEAPDNLVDALFTRGSPPARKHAMRFVGDSLGHTGTPVDSEPLQLLRALWEWRMPHLAVASAAEGDAAEAARDELAEFGVWFASRAFDLDWSLAQLLQVLRLTRRIEHEVEVVECLVEVSEDQPAEAVACLASIDIVGRDDHWITELWRADAKTIIRRVLRSPDQPTQAAARELVNRWVALGWIDFRDLLDEPE